MTEPVPQHIRQGDRQSLLQRGLRSGLKWSLRLLGGIILLTLILLTSLSAILSTISGSAWLLDRATALLNTETQQFSFRSAEGTFLRGLNLQGVRWQSGNNALSIAQLHSRWNPMTLLEGEFHVESLRIAGLQLNIDSDPDAPPSSEPFVLDSLLEPVLPLPIALRVSNARFDGARINLGDTEYVISLLSFNASLRGHQLELQQLEFNSSPVSLQTSLTVGLQQPYPLQAQLDWQLDRILLENTDAPSGSLQLQGDLDRLQVEHRLQGIAGLLSSGEILLDLGRFLNSDIATLNPRLDLEHNLLPQAIPGMDNYTIQALRLRTQGTPQDLGLFAAAQLDAAVTADIELYTDLNLRAYLRGTHLRVDELAMRTTNGLLNISGDVDWSSDLLVTLDYALDDAAPDTYLPTLPDNVRIRDLLSKGSLRLTRPADLDAMQLAFQIDNLSANLNEFEFSGQGSLAFDGERWQVDDLSLQTGENQLAMSAVIDANNVIAASASIDAPSLAAIYPDLSGRLHADAEISGSVSEPIIDLDLLASEIRFQQYLIPELTMTGQNRAGMNELELRTGNITLPVGEQTETISDVLIRLRGQPDAHNMLLRISSSLGGLRINADGAMTDSGWQGRLLSSEVDSAEYGRWVQQQSASLSASSERLQVTELCWLMLDTSLCLNGDMINNNQLDAGVRLENYPLTAFNTLASETTISQESGVTFYENPAYASVRLPYTLPADIALQGGLSVSIAANGPLDDFQQMNIDVRAQSNNGSLFMRGEALTEDAAFTEPVINHFTWPTMEFSAIQDAGSWQANSSLRFLQQDPDSPAVMRGSADASITVANDQSLDGSVQVDFDDLGWLEAMVPQLNRVTGELAGQLSVRGSLQNPLIGGDIMLSQTAFGVPALSLDLQAIEATLSSDDSERFVLRGYLESGTGSLNFTSEISQPFADERSFSLQLAGSDFSVANLDEMKVSVSPDLRLDGNLQGINVNGQLHIPMVDARVSTLPESAVDVSSDTILISQSDSTPAVRNAAITESGIFGDIPVSGEVTVTLGDDVRFAGFGLSARLTGELDITQRPAATPLTYGELEVREGTFVTYGRTLAIEQGKLLFMGSYDNPAIDIRAVREVDNMRVGVQMTGTIRNISSNLFSTPTLPDGDILAVMITGRPMAEIGTEQDGNALIGAATSLGISQSKGITSQIQNQLGLDSFSINSSGDVNDSSLMLGKYITPKIFVRYAVGLFETESSLAIDYTVNDRVKLEATSGQSQSIDITYTVEQ